MTAETKAITFTTWPTSLYQVDLTAQDGPERGPETVSDMNRQLRELILSAEKQQKEYNFGVIGAQKSSLDILRWDHPCVHWLRRRIFEAVHDLTLDVLSGNEDLTTTVFDRFPVRAEGWAVVYRRGGSHRQHTHHDSVFSGTYYIETGGVGPSAGHLQLLDPRPAAVARGASPGVRAVKPYPGLLVAFPSWLPHSVKATLHGGGTRICVAWNAAFTAEES
ncbi:putative 2OG-Fe(II) oxygenase [Streptomyces tsukubensis]|uniref:putative 2OG-Fe(II) oxygenase n=1 Tax=Streptomyces tsukubensis TaxID=83656 RepID=UPI00344B43CE